MKDRLDVSNSQLLIDDSAIDSYARVHRTIHQPQKFGPVLRAEMPWEGNCVVLYGSVVRRQGRYMMWYQTFNKVEPPENTYVCYAESEDGVHWHRPQLSQVEYRGSKENNIVMVPPGRGLDSPSVILDESDSAERRFKMMFYSQASDRKRGLFASFSEDGLAWSVPRLVAPNVGDRTNLMIKPRSERPYVAFTRRSTMMRDHLRRVIYLSDSADFESWSDPQLIVAPDLADDNDLQFYGMSGFPYSDMYVGFVQCLHSKADINDVQLVSSRDGRSWSRSSPRTTFMPVGPSSGWDTTWISFSSSPPIANGDRLFLYYEDRNASHGQAYPFPRGHIGLATLRTDGFASIDAGPVWGWVQTRAMEWPGGDLVVNVNSKAAAGVTDGGQMAGQAAAEVLSDSGGTVDGFDRESSDSFTGDSTGHRFNWSGRSLDELKGEVVKIRFHLLNSQLYSFRAQ